MVPDGTQTPAEEPSDDFFSSWDKPAIKRPSNPPSRTASPFLSVNQNGATSTGPPKSPSPLAATESPAAPAVIRTTSVVRETGARKANIFGAKKGQKMGAKPAGNIDFEAEERKAREEAERIKNLGYDAEAEKAEALSSDQVKVTGKTNIAAPTAISPPEAGYASKQSPQRRSAEVERLGMGMGRLGFGQTGNKQSVNAPMPSKLGFGAVGARNGKVLAYILTLFR